VLERMEPSITALIEHVEDKTDYVEPRVAGSHDDEAGTAGDEGEVDE
jgi:hypothetical protein